MVKLNSGVKELLKAVCLNDATLNECIDIAQRGLNTRYELYLPVVTKFDVSTTIKLTRDNCTIEPDYNKWYDKEDFDKFEIPENSAIIEVTDTGVVLSEESKYISELDDDTVKFMVIDLKGVLE